MANLSSRNWKALAIVAAVSILITGCAAAAPTKQEAAFIEDCKSVQANFEEYASSQKTLEAFDILAPERDWVYWTPQSAAMIEGADSRATAQNAIEKYFPWAIEETQRTLAPLSRKQFLKKDPGEWSDQYIDNFYGALFNQIAKGTKFKFDAKKLHAIAEENNSGYIDGPSLFQLISDQSPSERFPDCDSALGTSGDQGLSAAFTEVGTGSDIGAPISQISTVAIGLWGCKRFGVGYVDYGSGSDKCAGSDFDSSKYASCTGKLKTTINSAAYGDCGELSFEIFQADANTGDCMALGWWTDKNGNQQVGAFMFCGLEEGSSYTEPVSVGTDTTYTNNYGVDKTVISFLDGR